MLTFCAAFFYLSICKVIKFAFKRRECFFNKQRQNFNIFIKTAFFGCHLRTIAERWTCQQVSGLFLKIHFGVWSLNFYPTYQ